ncbi:Hypothetical protein ERS075552_00010 [Mycobacteroides abscessus]|nr:Hypothetical protein ERS075552_00010 [Mycobacteroides abscessus]CPW85395.1 Hypothetical protein ERS075547_08573 [Mycobacteroides abscessus]
MSDEPSDAQKLMAEVLKPLIYADMRYPDELFAQRRAEAYAAEVDKALGGLKREIRGRRGVTTHVRFVSGWTVTE